MTASHNSFSLIFEVLIACDPLHKSCTQLHSYLDVVHSLNLNYETKSTFLSLIYRQFPVNFAEPKPPADVLLTAIGKDTAVVTWSASSSMCDNVVGNYSVRYRLTDTSASSTFTTVYTTTTSVVLQGLVPDAEYTVSVAAINAKGDISAYSVGDISAYCATTMANPTCGVTQSKPHHITAYT